MDARFAGEHLTVYISAPSFLQKAVHKIRLSHSLGDAYALTCELRQFQAYQMSVALGMRTERNIRVMLPDAESFERRRSEVRTADDMDAFMAAAKESVEHELEPYTASELETVTRLIERNGSTEVVPGLRGSLLAALMPLVLAEDG